ncbi:MAG: peptidoglycan-binding protein, partial [Nitrososphaera sp.]|nr:peptidoglycan-binding protein [Nitrososphaera sp.]
GQRLLAHELTHVVQQSKTAPAILRRQPAGNGDECGERGPAAPEPGPPLIYHYLEARQRGVSETLRSKRPAVGHAQRLLNEFLKRYDNTKTGTGDQIGCAGNLKTIEAKRQSLPKQLKVDCWFGDDTKRATEMFQMCTGLKVDGKIGEKTWPVLEATLAYIPPKEKKDDKPKEKKPKVGESERVCGPDITDAVSAAVKRTKAAFGTWTTDDREEACDALDTMPAAGIAWDIEDLALLFLPKKSKNNWLRAEYGLKGCANPLNSECNPTVQMGSGANAGCWFPESVNYVIFGVMCRLCFDEGHLRFTEKYMNKTLIEAWKWLTSQSKKSPNAKAWASAGYNGWPSAGTPTNPDEPSCQTICPVKFPKSNAAVTELRVRWVLRAGGLVMEIRWM